MKQTRVLLLCGGRSDEHEVSLTSARSVLAAMEKTSLSATAQVITREGRWLSAAESTQALAAGKALRGGESALRAAHLVEKFDVVFPLLHGPYGEDGTVQGMLALAGMPFVGSGVLASALCMDKVMSKEVLRANGVPQVPYTLLTHHDFLVQPQAAWERLRTLRAPWFVKPSNLGSSVGISKAKDEAALKVAIEAAFAYDRRVIVEQGVPEVRELEVAMLGNAGADASVVGEITYTAEFYDYATKYTDGRSTMHIPADVPAAVAARVQELALLTYRLLDCAGLARVDFFYRAKSNELLLNEVNTMPGFTPFSMYPKLWEAKGVSYGALIEKLVALALERS